MLTGMTWRSSAILLVTIIATAWTTFVAIRLRSTYTNEEAVNILQRKVQELERQIATHKEIDDARFIDMNRAIDRLLVVPVPNGGGTTRVERWQSNRDQALQKRIGALEQWRLRIEGQAKH